jgi:hypothetical protein
MKSIRSTIKTLASSGIKHIVVEHLRIPTNSPIKDRNILWKSLECNYLDLYKEYGHQTSRINFELSSKQKLENINIIKSLCHENGVTFGSGDNDFHHLSDSVCCCGVISEGHFRHLYDSHIGNLVYEGFTSGHLDLSLIEKKWQPDGSIGEFINSDCRVKECNTVLDFLHDQIENNKSNSPALFYGIDYDADHGYYLDEAFRNKHIFME